MDAFCETPVDNIGILCMYLSIYLYMPQVMKPQFRRYPSGSIHYFLESLEGSRSDLGRRNRTETRQSHLFRSNGPSNVRRETVRKSHLGETLQRNGGASRRFARPSARETTTMDDEWEFRLFPSQPIITLLVE